jgi:hypothetical protein
MSARVANAFLVRFQVNGKLVLIFRLELAQSTSVHQIFIRVITAMVVHERFGSSMDFAA